MPTARLLAALLALVCACATAQTAPATTTWKWRDASGRLVASDLPPPASVAAKDILERPTDLRRIAPPAPKAAASAPTAAAAANSGAPRVDPELEARRRRAAEEQTAQAKAQQAQDNAARAENCVRAKGHLQALSEGQRMTRTNAQGEREVLDDKGRAEEMQRARAAITSDCK